MEQKRCYYGDNKNMVDSDGVDNSTYLDEYPSLKAARS